MPDSMVKRVLFTLGGSILLVVASGHSAAEAIDPIVEAKQFVDRLAAGQFELAANAFDETMAKAMPAAKLEQTWGQLLAFAGPFREPLDTRSEKAGKFDVVHVTCAFEKQKLVARVVLDSQGRISGLWFGPPRPAAKYSPPPYADPMTFAERQVLVGKGEWELPGTLTMPREGGPFPAVVLVHGSGPQDRDETIGPNKVFQDLAWGLASRGVAVLRYDKRTKIHGSRLARLEEFTVREEVTEDALSAIQTLRAIPELDAGRIYVLGHSLGGTLAPRIAEEEGKLAGIILLAGAARPLADIIVEQFEYLAKLDGIVSEDERRQLDEVAQAAARVQDPALTKETPTSELPFGIPASYWLDLRAYRPDEVAQRLDLPILILHGSRDYQVTKRDYELWRKALAGKSNVTFQEFKGLNHLFGRGTGRSTPAEYEKRTPVEEAVIDTIVEWILKRD